jgi:surfactin synthase thioesterase subunit
VTGEHDDPTLWIRRFHPAPQAAVQLVCLAHAGGSASYFFPVSRALSTKADVLAVQYPGRQDRRNERNLETIEELADAVTRQLLGHTDRPLALFGHSMGATLGFEIALRLEQRHGIKPFALFASGRRAPSRHRDERVHLRDDAGLMAEIQRLNGTTSQVMTNDEILRAALPAIRADYKAAETYRYKPGPRLDAPIHAHIGDQDPKVTVDEARSWQDHTDGHFELHTYRGGHFYLNDHAPRLIDSIAGVLTGADRVPTTGA